MLTSFYFQPNQSFRPTPLMMREVVGEADEAEEEVQQEGEEQEDLEINLIGITD